MSALVCFTPECVSPDCQHLRWLDTDNGSWTQQCNSRCRLELVRPGKVQCDCDTRCVCCGRTDNLMWRRGDHMLAVTAICRPCKFGACEECK